MPGLWREVLISYYTDWPIIGSVRLHPGPFYILQAGLESDSSASDSPVARLNSSVPLHLVCLFIFNNILSQLLYINWKVSKRSPNGFPYQSHNMSQWSLKINIDSERETLVFFCLWACVYKLLYWFNYKCGPQADLPIGYKASGKFPPNRNWFYFSINI